MDIRSAIALQEKKAKSMPLRQKIEYIWEYYKSWILIGILIVTITVYSIYAACFRQEKALYVTLVNATGYESSIFDEFLDAAGFPTDRYSVDVNATLTLTRRNPSVQDAKTLEVLYALFGTGNMDLFAADEEMFDFFAETGAMADLMDYLSPEFLAENESRLHKVTLLSSGEEIVAGIYPEESSRFYSAGYYEKPVPLGVVTDAINIGTAVACLIWLVAPSD